MNGKDQEKAQGSESAGVETSGAMNSSPCHMERQLEPCTLVILGASGDLTRRKLVPALFNLYQTKVLPDPFLIVGCGRSEMKRWGVSRFCRDLCPVIRRSAGKRMA